MYELVHSTTQGADHIKHGIPCEDYGMVHKNELCNIFVVADGHGDSNCPRSSFGSKTACEVTTSELEKFCSDLKDNDWESRILLEGKERDSLIKHLVSSIVANWDKIIHSDIEANPLSDEERTACSSYIERYDKGERLEHIYGTTLIAGLLTEKYLLLLQQGDGRCVVFNSDGTVSQPIPWDDRCFANVTTSMCDEDAADSFRYTVLDVEENSIIACFAGSDGVEDSFSSMDLMHSYYRDLLIYSDENGFDSLKTYLDENLPEFSSKGSGDDVTICGIVDCDKISDHLDGFKRDNEIIHIESLITEIDDRIKSMNGMGKLDALKRKCEVARSELEEAKKTYDETIEKYNTCLSDIQKMKAEEDEQTESSNVFKRLLELVIPGDHLEMFERKADELKNNLDIAKEMLDEKTEKADSSQKEYSEYLMKKDEYETKKKEYELKLFALRDE